MHLAPSTARLPEQIACMTIPHQHCLQACPKEARVQSNAFTPGVKRPISRKGRRQLLSLSSDISSGVALNEQNVLGMTEMLNSLKWGSNGLVTVIVQVSGALIHN